MKLLLAILLLASTAYAEAWPYRVPLRDEGDREYSIPVRINGQAVSCLFDTGASAPQHGIWLKREYAASRGLSRQGSTYHYYEGLNVTAGNFSRSNVLSYEYAAIDHPCLIGLSFFKGRSKFLIDLNSNKVFIK